MKVFAVPLFSARGQMSVNHAAQNSQPQFVSNLKMSTPLKQDTVSFKGKSECKAFGLMNEGVCNDFGLMKKNCEDYGDNLAGMDINNLFSVMQKENKKGEAVLDSFVWNSKQGKVQFFGDEQGLAKFLENSGKKVTHFSAEADEETSRISYDSEKFHYNLTYDKDTHQLRNAVAAVIRNDENKQFETIILKPSSKNEGKYIAEYRFRDSQNGEDAFENSFILFNKDMRIEKSQTAKNFRYSDGAQEILQFSNSYDTEGYGKITDDRDYEHYSW